MSEHKEPIPSMIYNAAVGGHVTNSQQIIDENENKEQSQINAEVKQTLGQGGSVDARIDQAKNDIIGGASFNGNTLKKVEDRVSPLESAVGSGGSVDSRIAAAKSELKGNATPACDTLGEAEVLISELRILYNNLQQSQPIPVTSLPATGETGKIYRLAGTTSYADYMYSENDLTTPIKMAEYDNAIDNEPTTGSDNLVKSGGVKKAISQLSSFVVSSDIGGTGEDYAINLDKDKNYIISVEADDLEASVYIRINGIDLPRLYAGHSIEYSPDIDTNSIYVWWVRPCSLNIISDTSLPFIHDLLMKTINDAGKVKEDIGNINYIEKIEKPTLQIIDGKYINPSGNIDNDTSSVMTEHFILKKGWSVVIEAGGYLTNHAIFSEVIEPNVSYKPLCISIDSTKRLYTYDNNSNRDMYIAISCDKNVTGDVVAYLYFNKALSKLLSSVKLINPNVVSGKFIDVNGNVVNDTPCSYTNPFTVNHCEIIHLVANGYLSTFSMIAKVIEEDVSYEPCIISHDGKTEYFYINTGESAKFAVSYITSGGATIEIINIPNTSALVDYINKKNTILKENSYLNNAYAGIPVVGIIGDSLSSGVTLNESGDLIPNYNFAWWKILERNSGQIYKGFCKSGFSAKYWLEDVDYGLPKALESSNKCCAYIVALGVNDQYYGDTIGSITDIDDSDYHNNADTFYGNYGKIIQILTEASPKSLFLLMTVPRTNCYSYNEAIRNIANHFSNCYLVDLANNEMDFFNQGYIHNSMYGGGHYNSATYAVIGKVMEQEISKVIVDNYLAFRYIQFALD